MSIIEKTIRKFIKLSYIQLHLLLAFPTSNFPTLISRKFEVTGIFLHEDFDHTITQNDIALLKTSEDFKERKIFLPILFAMAGVSIK